jgi:four helix bundle protein
MGAFYDLEVWKESHKFRNEIFLLTKKFPEYEKYKLTDQILRSSRSVTQNIAEGHGRFHYQENIQSCRVARGSLSETLDHLICARDCGYIDRAILKIFKNRYDQILKLLNGYIAYLKDQKQGD